MFVDTRLHIAVRPALEYRLPCAARAVVGALVGDRTREEALLALEECLEKEEEREEGDEGGDDDRLVELRRLGARVCTHAHEHLQSLADAWREHLVASAAAVRRTTRALAQGVAEAREVRDRYLARARPTVEREFRLEMARLARELDTLVARVRDAPGPTCERPRALVEATHALKEAFAASYGTVPMVALMRAKAHFEHELVALQAPLAAAFVRAASKVLA